MVNAIVYLACESNVWPCEALSLSEENSVQVNGLWRMGVLEWRHGWYIEGWVLLVFKRGKSYLQTNLTIAWMRSLAHVPRGLFVNGIPAQNIWIKPIFMFGNWSMFSILHYIMDAYQIIASSMFLNPSIFSIINQTMMAMESIDQKMNSVSTCYQMQYFYSFIIPLSWEDCSCLLMLRVDV